MVVVKQSGQAVKQGGKAVECILREHDHLVRKGQGGICCWLQQGHLADLVFVDF